MEKKRKSPQPSEMGKISSGGGCSSRLSGNIGGDQDMAVRAAPDLIWSYLTFHNYGQSATAFLREWQCCSNTTTDEGRRSNQPTNQPTNFTI